MRELASDAARPRTDMPSLLDELDRNMKLNGPGVSIVGVIVLTLAFCLVDLAVAPEVRAQPGGPSPDSACRNCHSGSTQEFHLPSGEVAVVGVDLDTIDASPHSAYGLEEVYCTSCHAGTAGRYRYPHETNPASSMQEFATEVSGNCEQCHYAHKPFHPIAGSESSELEGELPVCSDCHGGHGVARVEAISIDMPMRCLACHDDQNETWAATFLEPRPGMGVGAEGYAGSTRCNGCHDDLYFTWHDTLHGQLIQDAATRPDAILGDFDSDSLQLPVSEDDVTYTIGSRWRQAYLVATASESPTATHPAGLELLPVQWLVESETWAPLEEGGTIPADWISECGSCHVTGLDTETWGFVEFGVGCEACHGPAAEHAADPLNVKPFSAKDDQVCGACHSRGVSTDGQPFPASFRPGDSLSDHFTLTSSDADVWPDGSARRNHQQFMDWNLGNSMSLSEDVQCVTCHAVHTIGVGEGQLHTERNELCVQCHGQQASLGQHTPFHQQAIRENEFYCTDCHMPTMASSAEQFDLRNHSFLQPNPEQTLLHGGVEQMPNACNMCHTANAETPEWAVQTIEHAKSFGTEVSFFGPGPTPASPPPPTPMPSVGQLATVEVTPPFWWLRWVAFIAVGLAVLVGLVWLGRSLVVRRGRNA